VEESVIVPIYKKGDKTGFSNYRGISLLPSTYKFLIPYVDEILGIITVENDTTGQLLIIYSAFVKYLRKWEYSDEVHQLFIGFKKAYDSIRREFLYNILIEFGIPMKLVRLIKMCLNETYNIVE